MGPAAQPPVSLTRRDGLIAATVAALAFAVFFPALDYAFVNLDDLVYVVHNKDVKDGLSARGVAWAFTTFHSANWHPLTWLSLQLDATLWHKADGQPDPRGFHLTNVLLHAANAALAYLALRALTRCVWPSVMAAVLFAVHPLRVESVAWVTERKDVLSASFGLLALWAYAGYARQPSARRYGLVAGAFALSLLAKPMLVTLPCLLLVLDWWPLRRAAARRTEPTAKSTGVQNEPTPPGAAGWPRLVLEKVPLLALALAASVVTFLAQRAGGAVRQLDTLPVGVRVENAILSYAVYLVDSVWPVHLAAFYPHPYYAYDGSPALTPARVAAAALLVLAITAAAWLLRKWAPYLLAGWLWYVGTLVPVIGLIQVGTQGHADRYTYFPQLGLLVALCWGGADLARGRWPRVALASAAAAALTLTVLTEGQLPVWSKSPALWEQAYRVSGKCPTVLVNRGEMFEQQGKRSEALECFLEAVRLDPTSGQIRLDLGNAWQARGDLAAAANEFAEACQLEPKSPGGFTNLGLLLLRQGEPAKARDLLQTASELAPDLPEAHFNLGLAEDQLNNDEQARAAFETALRLRPTYAPAKAFLGAALVRLGRADEGLALLNDVVRANPRSVEAHYCLGQALARQGDLNGALQQLGQAIDLNPGLTPARMEIGVVLARQGRDADALTCLSEVVRRDRGTLAGLQERLRSANRPELADELAKRLPPAP